MELFSQIVAYIYVYCTDFIINLANIFGLSYYEINALIFCVIFPLFTAILTFVYILQKVRLRKTKNNSFNIKPKTL